MAASGHWEKGEWRETGQGGGGSDQILRDRRKEVIRLLVGEGVDWTEVQCREIHLPICKMGS